MNVEAANVEAANVAEPTATEITQDLQAEVGALDNGATILLPLVVQ